MTDRIVTDCPPKGSACRATAQHLQGRIGNRNDAAVVALGPSREDKWRRCDGQTSGADKGRTHTEQTRKYQQRHSTIMAVGQRRFPLVLWEGSSSMPRSTQITANRSQTAVPPGLAILKRGPFFACRPFFARKPSFARRRFFTRRPFISRQPFSYQSSPKQIAAWRAAPVA